jgi:hypothetical protein
VAARDLHFKPLHLVSYARSHGLAGT